MERCRHGLGRQICPDCTQDQLEPVPARPAAVQHQFDCLVEMTCRRTVVAGSRRWTPSRTGFVVCDGAGDRTVQDIVEAARQAGWLRALCARTGAA